jgi:hypothetical protein
MLMSAIKTNWLKQLGQSWDSFAVIGAYLGYNPEAFNS